MDVPVGKVVYTGLFNDRGTFESDLCVVRLAEDHYYIVSGTGQTVRDFDWIRRNIARRRARRTRRRDVGLRRHRRDGAELPTPF